MSKGAYIGVDGVARKVKKGYVGVTEATNLVSDGSFENVASNWNCWLTEPTDTAQAKYGTQSLKLGGDALASTTDAVVPIYGHKYYGREYIKTEGQLDAADCRFELCGAVGGAEKSYVFGWNRGNYPDWSIISNIVTIDHDTTDGFGVRTFTVGGTVNAWVDGLIIVDLTATYGAGNEPTKEWCDANIPFFNGVGAVPHPKGGGVARKIKKAYIGIGGVARPCWSGGELAYYGTITGLSVARYKLAATSVGNYGIFAGGEGSSVTAAAEAYSESLVQTVLNNLSVGRYALAAATVGNYALFAGGYSSAASKKVDAYDITLTRTTVDDTLNTATYMLMGASGGKYAFFAGGYATSAVSTVNAYDEDLTLTVASSNLISAVYNGAATAIGSYVLFGGGKTSSAVQGYVNAYDVETLTRTLPSRLPTSMVGLSAATVGKYALFSGGADSTGTSLSATIVYDESLTRTTASDLSAAREAMSATALGKYAIFAGGTSSVVVDAYDNTLTRTTQTNLSQKSQYGAATAIGNYALFGGGTGSGYKSAVDCYTID